MINGVCAISLARQAVPALSDSQSLGAGQSAQIVLENRRRRLGTIAAEPQAIWDVIADFGAISSWADIVDHSCLLNPAASWKPLVILSGPPALPIGFYT